MSGCCLPVHSGPVARSVVHARSHLRQRSRYPFDKHTAKKRQTVLMLWSAQPYLLYRSVGWLIGLKMPISDACGTHMEAVGHKGLERPRKCAGATQQPCLQEGGAQDGYGT